MRRLTVLSVAYSLAPVGPNAVGGSEQVLTSLDQALVAAGHRNIVVACEGSQTAGELVSFPGPTPGRRIDGRCRVGKQRAMRRLIGACRTYGHMRRKEAIPTSNPPPAATAPAIARRIGRDSKYATCSGRGLGSAAPMATHEAQAGCGTMTKRAPNARSGSGTGSIG